MGFFSRKNKIGEQQTPEDMGVSRREYNKASSEVSSLIGKNSTDTKAVHIGFEDGETALYIISHSSLKWIVTTHKKLPYSIKERMLLLGRSEENASEVEDIINGDDWFRAHRKVVEAIGVEEAEKFFEHNLIEMIRSLDEKGVNEAYITFLIDEQSEEISQWPDDPSIDAYEIDNVLKSYDERLNSAIKSCSMDQRVDDILVSIDDSKESENPIIKFANTMEQPIVLPMLVSAIESYPEYYVYETLADMEASGVAELSFVSEDYDDELPEENAIIDIKEDEENRATEVEKQSHGKIIEKARESIENGTSILFIDFDNSNTLSNKIIEEYNKEKEGDKEIISLPSDDAVGYDPLLEKGEHAALMILHTKEYEKPLFKACTRNVVNTAINGLLAVPEGGIEGVEWDKDETSKISSVLDPETMFKISDEVSDEHLQTDIRTLAKEMKKNSNMKIAGDDLKDSLNALSESKYADFTHPKDNMIDLYERMSIKGSLTILHVGDGDVHNDHEGSTSIFGSLIASDIISSAKKRRENKDEEKAVIIINGFLNIPSHNIIRLMEEAESARMTIVLSSDEIEDPISSESEKAIETLGEQFEEYSIYKIEDTDWHIEDENQDISFTEKEEGTSVFTVDPHWETVVSISPKEKESIAIEIDRLEKDVYEIEKMIVATSERYYESIGKYVDAASKPNQRDRKQPEKERKESSDLFFEIDRLENDREELNKIRKDLLLSMPSGEDYVEKRLLRIENVDNIAKRDHREDEVLEEMMPEDSIFRREDYDKETNPIYYKIVEIMGKDIFDED